METTPLKKQLEEFQLITSSLLLNESLTFLDEKDLWFDLALDYADPTVVLANKRPRFPARFQIDISRSPVSFLVEVPTDYEGQLAKSPPIFKVKGDQITRMEQDRWQDIIEEKLREIEDTEFPIYQLLLLHLLPLVHEKQVSQPSIDPAECSPKVYLIYHALLTSHHLISPNKRRSLQNWSASLSISGFAKVGYPGVIYASGSQDSVEEFVRNVKAMQWLALKVRFVEELPKTVTVSQEKRWSEFQKVGEVVEEMRRLGREQYIIEMGIGSIGGE